jgi:hypothetical protein
MPNRRRTERLCGARRLSRLLRVVKVHCRPRFRQCWPHRRGRDVRRRLDRNSRPLRAKRPVRWCILWRRVCLVARARIPLQPKHDAMKTPKQTGVHTRPHFPANVARMFLCLHFLRGWRGAASRRRDMPDRVRGRCRTRRFVHRVRCIAHPQRTRRNANSIVSGGAEVCEALDHGIAASRPRGSWVTAQAPGRAAFQPF